MKLDKCIGIVHVDKILFYILGDMDFLGSQFIDLAEIDINHPKSSRLKKIQNSYMKATLSILTSLLDSFLTISFM